MATVYEWRKGKVLKLFHEGYPKDAVEKEFYNAKAINDLDFAKRHKTIIRNRVANVPNYKVFLKDNIANVLSVDSGKH